MTLTGERLDVDSGLVVVVKIYVLLSILVYHLGVVFFVENLVRHTSLRSMLIKSISFSIGFLYILIGKSILVFFNITPLVWVYLPLQTRLNMSVFFGNSLSSWWLFQLLTQGIHLIFFPSWLRVFVSWMDSSERLLVLIREPRLRPTFASFLSWRSLDSHSNSSLGKPSHSWDVSIVLSSHVVEIVFRLLIESRLYPFPVYLCLYLLLLIHLIPHFLKLPLPVRFNLFLSCSFERIVIKIRVILWHLQLFLTLMTEISIST